MAYKKLSDLLVDLDQPQKSDTFVKLFRAAVRDGKIEAMDLGERFTMPKVFNRRGQQGTYQRPARDMLFEVTSDSEKWFEETKAALQKTGSRQRKVKPSVETIESGEFDFKAAAEETRRKMQANFSKGQQLGNSRAKTRKSK